MTVADSSQPATTSWQNLTALCTDGIENQLCSILRYWHSVGKEGEAPQPEPPPPILIWCDFILQFIWFKLIWLTQIGSEVLSDMKPRPQSACLFGIISTVYSLQSTGPTGPPGLPCSLWLQIKLSLASQPSSRTRDERQKLETSGCLAREGCE